MKIYIKKKKNRCLILLCIYRGSLIRAYVILCLRFITIINYSAINLITQLISLSICVFSLSKYINKKISFKKLYQYDSRNKYLKKIIKMKLKVRERERKESYLIVIVRGWINCRAPFNLYQNVSSPCQNASIKNILKKNTSTKNNYKKILSK